MPQLAWLISLIIVAAGVACGDDGTGDRDAATGTDSGGSECAGLLDGTPCGTGLVCWEGRCVAFGCGDGLVHSAGGEQCDDGNDVDGDGCDGDCTYSCVDSIECIDADVCTGDEICDPVTHACAAGEPLDCDDGDPCTADSCNSVDGCGATLVDEDGDGHAPATLGPCGGDCDDTRADIFPGAEELCDGIDNNCNMEVDEVAPTWFVDCDADGFAASTDGSQPGCAEPTAGPPACPPGGRWTARRPLDAASTDCNDSAATVFPGQTTFFTTPIAGRPGEFDYNCDGMQERQYGCIATAGNCGPSCAGGYLPHDDVTNPNGCRYWCPVLTCSLVALPDCGTSASYQGCNRSCMPLRPGPMTQGCR